MPVSDGRERSWETTGSDTAMYVGSRWIPSQAYMIKFGVVLRSAVRNARTSRPNITIPSFSLRCAPFPASDGSNVPPADSSGALPVPGGRFSMHSAGSDPAAAAISVGFRFERHQFQIIYYLRLNIFGTFPFPAAETAVCVEAGSAGRPSNVRSVFEHQLKKPGTTVRNDPSRGHYIEMAPAAMAGPYTLIMN